MLRAWKAVGKGAVVLAVWTGRLLVGVLIVLVLAIAYLHLVGIPGVWLDPLLEMAAREGYFLTVEGVHLEIDRGVVARGVKVFAREEDPAALVTADELSAAVRPWDLLARGKVVPSLELRGGQVNVPLGGADGTRKVTVPVGDIRIRFTLQEGEMVLKRFEARTLGLLLVGRGAIYLGPEKEQTKTEEVDRPLELVLKALEEVPETVVGAVETLQKARFEDGASPVASFTFTFYPEHPEENAMAVSLEGGKGRLDALEWSALGLAARWREGRLDLERLRLALGDEAIEESGWFVQETGEAFVKLESSLRPSQVAKALPPEWVAEATNWVRTLDFPLRLEATAGPGPVDGLYTQVVVKAAAQGIVARGLSVDEVRVEARLGDGVLEMPSAHFTVSEDGIGGKADITDVKMDLATGNFVAFLDGRLVPTWADRFLPDDWSGMHDLLSRFAFRTPGTMKLRIEGTADDPYVKVRGPCEATDFDLHGVPVDKASAMLVLSEGIVRLRRFLVVRGDTVARGDVAIDIDRETVHFKAESTLQLGEAAGLFGPEVRDFLGNFRFEGPTAATAEGVFDFCSFALNDITGHLDAQRAGMGPWLADTISGDIRVKGLDVEISDAEARIYGGHAKANVRFYPVLTDDHWRYEANLEMEDIQLGEFLSATLGESTNDLRGAVTGNASLAGYIDDQWADSIAGSGKAKIHDGWIFQAPVFSGLTSVLQLMVPGVSFFAQTEAGASFAIRDGRVWTDDASVEGSLFSVAAAGSYGLDNSLDFDVQVELMRGGIVARVVRFLTSPLTHLLKFTVSGPVEDAKWRPTNLNPAKLVKLAADGAVSLANVVGLAEDENKDADGEKGAKKVRPVKPLPVPDAPAMEEEKASVAPVGNAPEEEEP